jgi:hypothetical protein
MIIDLAVLRVEVERNVVVTKGNELCKSDHLKSSWPIWLLVGET